MMMTSQRWKLLASSACFLALGLVGSISHRGFDTSISIKSSYYYNYYYDNRPPLSSLIDHDNITAPVDWLLDFVIAGHPKCATTSIMHALFGHHAEIQMYNHEIYELQNGKPAALVDLLYQLPAGSHYKRGYKAPNEIRRQQSLWLLQKHFPHAKLIIGLRHPIEWFQSWWNFKTAQGFLQNQSAMAFADNPPPMLEYHKNLAQLGKTNSFMNDERQRALLGRNFPRPVIKPSDRVLFRSLGMKLDVNYNTTMNRTTVPIQRLDNPVFLYVDDQVNDPATSTAFLASLQAFLGLRQSLAPIDHDNTAQEHPNPNRMDICHYQYRPLRLQLVRLGSNMADWILDYFVGLPNVTVSSPDQFRELLSGWKMDPCQGPLQFTYP